jgi:hypothetical protein
MASSAEDRLAAAYADLDEPGGYEDESDEITEEELLDFLEAELSQFERKLGRSLTHPEVEALAQGALAQAEAGREVDVQRDFDRLYPAGDPLTDTREQLAEAIEDSREDQAEHEGDGEGDDFDEAA